MDEGGTKEYLIEHDEHFRQLADEHQKYESKLADFNQKSFLTSEEQIEETVIKKKKLALKDKMQVLIDRHRTQKAIS